MMRELLVVQLHYVPRDTIPLRADQRRRNVPLQLRVPARKHVVVIRHLSFDARTFRGLCSRTARTLRGLLRAGQQHGPAHLQREIQRRRRHMRARAQPL